MKKAFLVGINKYNDAPLRGCVNDVVLLYKVISEKYGFDRHNIDIATDTECTKQRILYGLRHLVTGVKPGDTVLFSFSGHGSQVVVDDWTNSDEPDGRDEIICPVDLDWNDPLRDHQIGAIFKALPPGVKIVVILDCCHSGTGLRNTNCGKVGSKTDDDVVNRFMAPPPSNILLDPNITISDDLRFTFSWSSLFSTQPKKRDFLVHTVKQGDALLISGCEDNQLSADAWIGGRYHGALTYTLCEVLMENDYIIAYNELITKVNNKLAKKKFTQTPQLEGRNELFNKMFLGN